MTDLGHTTAEIMAYYRALDERATPRHHFRHADEEGGLWHFEAVPDRGELVAIRQAESTPAGRLHRYCWKHLEDEHGSLADQAIDPEEDPLEAIPAKGVRRTSLNEEAWKPVLAAAGFIPLPERGRPYAESRENGRHALRHFYASVLLDAGENIKALAEHLGHSDPGLSLRVYAHLMPSNCERTRKAVAAVFEGAYAPVR